jgi:hypothetical protein
MDPGERRLRAKAVAAGGGVSMGANDYKNIKDYVCLVNQQKDEATAGDMIPLYIEMAVNGVETLVHIFSAIAMHGHVF